MRDTGENGRRATANRSRKDIGQVFQEEKEQDPFLAAHPVLQAHHRRLGFYPDQAWREDREFIIEKARKPCGNDTFRNERIRKSRDECLLKALVFMFFVQHWLSCPEVWGQIFAPLRASRDVRLLL